MNRNWILMSCQLCGIHQSCSIHATHALCHRLGVACASLSGSTCCNLVPQICPWHYRCCRCCRCCIQPSLAGWLAAWLASLRCQHRREVHVFFRWNNSIVCFSAVRRHHRGRHHQRAAPLFFSVSRQLPWSVCSFCAANDIRIRNVSQNGDPKNVT